VTPGDRLDLYVTVLHHRSNVWKLRGEASVDGALCAEGELLASDSAPGPQGYKCPHCRLFVPLERAEPAA